MLVHMRWQDNLCPDCGQHLADTLHDYDTIKNRYVAKSAVCGACEMVHNRRRQATKDMNDQTAGLLVWVEPRPNHPYYNE